MRKSVLAFCALAISLSGMQVCVLAVALEKRSSVPAGVQHLQGESQRFTEFSRFCLDSQASIISEIEKEDGVGVFEIDPWERLDAGGSELMGYGKTCVIAGGDLIEKGAVSSTIMKGILSQQRAESINSRQSSGPAIKAGSSYYASALSLVLHSKSPMVPTFRADVRLVMIYFNVLRLITVMQ
jgi:coproporphyrinogen III oxidase